MYIVNISKQYSRWYANNKYYNTYDVVSTNTAIHIGFSIIISISIKYIILSDKENK